MTINIPFPNIFIDGNTFDYGTFTTNGSPSSTPTEYSYYYCVVVTSDAVISNNYMSGSSAVGGSANPQQIKVVSGSAVIQNNIFNRGTTPIYAYIVSTSTSDQVITNNFFDGYTVDNISNENLVVGLTPTSTYQNNKNQTGYMPIQKSPYLISSQIFDPPDINFADIVEYTDLAIIGDPLVLSLGGTTEGIVANWNNPFAEVGSPANGNFQVTTNSDTVNCNFTIGGTLDLTGAKVRFDNGSYYQINSATITGTTVTQIILATVYDGATNGSAFAKFYSSTGGTNPIDYGLQPATPTATFGILMDLNEMLPPGVQILSCVIGVGTNDASNLVGGSYNLSTFSSNPANYNLVSLAGSMADVNNFTMAATSTITSSFIIGSGVGQIPPANFAASTQYLIIDLTAPANAASAPYFVTGQNRKIPMMYTPSVTVNFGNTYMLESPLIVKYRW